MDIRVNFTKDVNKEKWGGGIRTLPIEEYLRYVVPAEMSARKGPEALKAQAVAARTYAYHKVVASPDAAYHVTDTTKHQSVNAGRATRATDDAVAQTAGMILQYGGRVIQAMFSASNGGRTKSAKAYGGTHYDYLLERPDPWDNGPDSMVSRSHRVGMSQYGAYAMASAGWTYDKILGFYYFRAELWQRYGSAGSGQALGTYMNETGKVVRPGGGAKARDAADGEDILRTLPDGSRFTVLEEKPKNGFCWLRVCDAQGHEDGWIRWDFTDFGLIPGQTGGADASSPAPGWEARYGEGTFAKSGTASGNVRRWQADINAWIADEAPEGLAPLAEDGKYGPLSIAACRRFQERIGLPQEQINGMAGPGDKTALFERYGRAEA